MIQLYVDADACPVKDEIFRVARRHRLPVLVVSNRRMGLPHDILIQRIVVGEGLDVADDWIAVRATSSDLVITADIPLAARCLARGARVLDHRGQLFTDESIGNALASREINAYLREMGVLGGGPKPYSARDRSQFLNTLENQIQALLKVQRAALPKELS
nr:YaiI/YqxD family protein [uncultured Holophaga sp.]